MNEALAVVPSTDLIGDGPREKLAIKLSQLKKDGYLSTERILIERYARKLLYALIRVSYRDLGLGAEELCSLECDELMILTRDIFDKIERRAKFIIVCSSVIPIFGWWRLVFSLSEYYNSDAFDSVAYWHAYKKIASKGDKAIELAFKYMRAHNFNPDCWD